MRIRYKYKKRLKKTSIVVSLLVLALVGGMMIQEKGNEEGQRKEEKEVLVTFKDNPLDVSDYVKIKVGLTPGKIYLVDNCTAVVMVTNRGKTFTIQRGLEDTLDTRPDAYDIFLDALETYEVQAELVKIEQVRENIYYARLFLKQGNDIVSIDSKPSDALAIATRFKAPIYIEKTLLESQGEEIC